ncbi:hypothetical protein [Thalassoglobus sp.]|uniref:hypothetical protein n=1 Tax=Thalassoglobus sp. TaxID=2795869 RepID=UPI003AA902A7
MRQVIFLAILTSGCPQTPPSSLQQPEAEETSSQVEEPPPSPSSTNDAKPPNPTKENLTPPGPPQTSSQKDLDDNRQNDLSAIENSRRLFKASQSKFAAGKAVDAFKDARRSWSLIKDLDDPEAENLKGEVFRHLEAVVSKLKVNNEGISSDQNRPLLLK